MNLQMNEKCNRLIGGSPASAVRADVAQAAQLCVNWCRAQGLEVLGIQKAPNKPRIFIKNSPLCASLDGAVHRFERIGNIERRYWFAIRFDCEVRWNEGEAK